MENKTISVKCGNCIVCNENPSMGSFYYGQKWINHGTDFFPDWKDEGGIIVCPNCLSKHELVIYHDGSYKILNIKKNKKIGIVEMKRD